MAWVPWGKHRRCQVRVSTSPQQLESNAYDIQGAFDIVSVLMVSLVFLIDHLQHDGGVIVLVFTPDFGVDAGQVRPGASDAPRGDADQLVVGTVLEDQRPTRVPLLPVKKRALITLTSFFTSLLDRY